MYIERNISYLRHIFEWIFCLFKTSSNSMFIARLLKRSPQFISWKATEGSPSLNRRAWTVSFDKSDCLNSFIKVPNGSVIGAFWALCRNTTFPNFEGWREISIDWYQAFDSWTLGEIFIAFTSIPSSLFITLVGSWHRSSPIAPLYWGAFFLAHLLSCLKALLL